jgi:peptidoglycan hydrolase-like protein with peptidoglycan-binding domain
VPSRKRRTNEPEAVAVSGGVIARHPREFVGFTLAAAFTAAIFVNALFLQKGPHPAPIFAPQLLTQREAALPPHRPQTVPAATRTQAEVTVDIQRELVRLGYYDGAVDGLWGAKTAAAARDFVQAGRLKLNTEPSEALLQAVVATSTPSKGANAAPMTAAPIKPVTTSPVAPAVAHGRNDPIAAVIAAPSKRLLAIQRALAEFGYGQIKPSGVYDQDTREAIEKFQRDRKLPVDGQVSDSFVHELGRMTGRTLEQ